MSIKHLIAKLNMMKFTKMLIRRTLFSLHPNYIQIGNYLLKRKSYYVTWQEPPKGSPPLRRLSIQNTYNTHKYDFPTKLCFIPKQTKFLSNVH